MERKRDASDEFKFFNEITNPSSENVSQPLTPAKTLDTYFKEIERLAYIGKELETFSKMSGIKFAEIQAYCQLMTIIDSKESKHF